MDELKDIFRIAACRLPAVGVDCLLVGGFAVNYYGYTRNTLDVDFMIVADQVETVHGIMAAAGYTDVAIQDNFAYFRAPQSALRVDFLRVDPATLSRLLDRAVGAVVYGYDLKIPALADLLAMKIFSLTHDLERRLGKDLPDIVYLGELHGMDPESDIRPLCNQFGTSAVYELIRRHWEALQDP